MLQSTPDIPALTVVQGSRGSKQVELCVTGVCLVMCMLRLKQQHAYYTPSIIFFNRQEHLNV